MMEKFQIRALSPSQLLAMLIYAAKNGVNNGDLVLDFCLRKSETSASRARASTAYEVLLNLPWLGSNGGVFIIANEDGKLLSMKFEQFSRWLAKLGSGTIGQRVETKITLLDLSELGRPMTGLAGENAMQTFKAWAGYDKLQTDIGKAGETLASWGVELVEPVYDALPPLPPNHNGWWQTVGAGAELSADISVITTGEAVDIESEGARGIFEAAKGGRSTRNSDKKIALAKKMMIQIDLREAFDKARGVVEYSNWGEFSSIGYSEDDSYQNNGQNNNGGYGEY